MTRSKRTGLLLATGAAVAWGLWLRVTAAQPPDKKPSSYLPVVEEKLDTVIARMTADKPKVEKRQADLLAQRYDLANHPESPATRQALVNQAALLTDRINTLQGDLTAVRTEAQTQYGLLTGPTGDVLAAAQEIAQLNPPKGQNLSAPQLRNYRTAVGAVAWAKNCPTQDAVKTVEEIVQRFARGQAI